MVIDSSGNVLINSGYIKLGGYSFIGEDLSDLDSLTIASDHTESIHFAHHNSGTYTTNMIINSSGQVGIGTTSPNSILHVGSTGTNAYSTTITKGSNMKGIMNTLSNNGDDMVGIYFATGSTTEGTHWSGITGSRTDNASHWGTQLNFYTHNNDVANLNDATQKMVIKGDGNVGIGTSSPNSILHLSSTGPTELLLSDTNAGSNVKNYGIYSDTGKLHIRRLTDAYSGYTPTITVDQSNVGIGTTSPNLSSSGTALTVNSSSGANAAVEISDGGTLAGLLWGRSGTGVNVWSIPSIPLIFGAANTERMRLNPSNQTMTLTANTATGTNYIQFNNNAGTAQGYIGFGSSGNNDLYIVQQSSSSNLQFQNGGSTRMLIDSSGSVGIGTTSLGTEAKLAIGATNANEGGQIVLHKGTSGTLAAHIDAFHSTNDYLRILSGTNTASSSAPFVFDLTNTRVGIGTTSPSDKLSLQTTSGDCVIGITGNSGGDPEIHMDSGNNRSGNIKYGDGSTLAMFRYSHNDVAFMFYAHNQTVVDFQVGENTSFFATSKLGIGTTSPTYKFHVASSNNVSIFEDTSGSSNATFCLFNAPSYFAMGSITRNGSAASVLYNTGSDYRLKEDLQDFNALDLVDNITAYDYK